MLFHSPRIVTDGLVLYLDAANGRSYPGSGTTWSDLSGNGNNGTLTNGPTYDTGSLGSIRFDGVNDYASIPSIMGVTNFSNTDNYTIDFWTFINPVQNTTTNGDNDIVEKWSGGAVPYPYTFRYIRASQIIQVAVYNLSTSNAVDLQVSTNKWLHIVSVFDWSNSLLKGYVNVSSSIASRTLNLTGNISNSSPLYLSSRGGSMNFFTGNISCLKIYNRALSPDEIKQNFNATRGRFGL